MKTKIVSRYDSNKVIYESEKETIREAVIEAVASDSNLSGSDLSDSNLSGCNLSRSNLSGSNLSRSDLSGSNLSGSDLSNSDLSGSDLSNSDLSDSEMVHVKFYGKGGTTKIKKTQIEPFHVALGIVVED